MSKYQKSILIGKRANLINSAGIYLFHLFTMGYTRTCKGTALCYPFCAVLTQMISTLDWETWQARHHMALLDILFKTHQQDFPSTAMSTRSFNDLKHSCRTDIHQHSAFFPETIHCWNKFPRQAVMSTFLSIFKTFI